MGCSVCLNMCVHILTRTGCDHLWLCISLITNDCALQQVVPRHKLRCAIFNEKMSLLQNLTATYWNLWKKVFNLQDRVILQTQKWNGRGAACEERGLHSQLFPSRGLPLASIAVYFQQKMTLEVSHYFCFKIPTIAFLLTRKYPAHVY